MKSYNAERRLRRAIVIVHVAVRFQQGIKEHPNLMESVAAIEIGKKATTNTRGTFEKSMCHRL
jgi:hypothetical protein